MGYSINTLMTSIQFSFEQTKVSKVKIDALEQKLNSSRKQLSSIVRKGDYESDASSINLCSDAAMVRVVKKAVSQVSKLKPKLIILVGIGGSNLGAVAIQEALLGKAHNTLGKSPAILYADTVDTIKTRANLLQLKQVLAKGGTVLVVSISKSGSTTETIALTEVYLALLQKYKSDYQNYVFVITGNGSAYWKLAKKNKFSVLTIPQQVGGRYSVLSTVGLFVLGCVGIDILQLLKGAKDMRTSCLGKKENPATTGASILYTLNKKGFVIYDLFLFADDLESLGKWYRQLLGESIGKQFSLTGKKVYAGIAPTVSLGSVDLHSVGQLYLGGPNIRYTTFVSVDTHKHDVNLPNFKEFDTLVPHIQKKSLHTLMDAIMQGTQSAYTSHKLPFSCVTLPELTAYTLGQFLQWKMMETMYLADLLNVNAFNQPNVESYKLVTKKILSK
jgi:glucose-6-phosphate isomerase